MNRITWLIPFGGELQGRPRLQAMSAVLTAACIVYAAAYLGWIAS